MINRARRRRKRRRERDRKRARFEAQEQWRADRVADALMVDRMIREGSLASAFAPVAELIVQAYDTLAKSLEDVFLKTVGPAYQQIVESIAKELRK